MINKNLIKIIGGGILVTTTAAISIIGAVVSESKKKAEKPNYGIYSDGYFKVVDTIVDSVSIIKSDDLPYQVKTDTIISMCGK